MRGSGAGVAGGEVGGEEAEELEEAGIWEGGRVREQGSWVSLLSVVNTLAVVSGPRPCATSRRCVPASLSCARHPG